MIADPPLFQVYIFLAALCGAAIVYARNFEMTQDTQESKLNRRLSVGEIRKRLVYQGSEPEDFEDSYLRWLVKDLYAKPDVVLVTVFDEDDQHIGVTFRNENHCSPATLEFMMENGFKTVQAGVQDYEYTNGEYYQNARAEFRPVDGDLHELIRTYYGEKHIQRCDHVTSVEAPRRTVTLYSAILNRVSGLGDTGSLNLARKDLAFACRSCMKHQLSKINQRS